jgi:hypothetical protein
MLSKKLYHSIHDFIILFSIVFIISFAISIKISNNENISANLENVNKSLESNSLSNNYINQVPKASQFGFNESEFEDLLIEEKDIIFPRYVISKTTQQFAPIYTILQYPSANNSWRIELPSRFSDARDFLIKRTPFEIYHPIEEDQFGSQHIGSEAHFEFPNEPTSDILNFTVRSPLAYFEKDSLVSTTLHHEYVLKYSRFDTRHTFERTLFIHQIQKPFPVYEVQFFNKTGGLDLNETENINMNITELEASFGTFLQFEIDMGLVLAGVDYEFRIIIDQGYVPPSFFGDWIANLLIPIVTGFFSGLSGTYAYMSWRRDIIANNREIFKWGIPIGIGLAVIFVLGSYLIFLYG